MNIKLTFGMGFSGTDYNLVIDNEVYSLLGTSMGSSNDEDKAKGKATSILKEKGIEVNIDELEFKWNGTL